MENKQIVKLCRELWRGMDGFRRNRERFKRYTYGDQWSDMVKGSDGRYRLERDFIIESGGRPYTNNLIRQLVKSIVGRYRMQIADSREERGEKPSELALRNSLDELDARLLEEFLISGAAVQRISTEVRGDCDTETRCWIDNVDPRHFFCNPGLDPRGYDISVAGQLHDMTAADIAARFGRGKPSALRRLARIFGYGSEKRLFGEEPDLMAWDGDEFMSAPKGKFRLIEVWTRETSHDGRRNWHCRWLTPQADVVEEYDSPWPHESHPYVMKFYPLIDGEIHSFVEDVIDQQRFINRLIVMMDRVLASSAKGVLLFPLDQLPDGTPLEEVADSWADCNGIIPVRGQGRELPRQIVSSGASEGAYRLLDLQLKMLDNVSGVSDALMGRKMSGVTGAELYEKQFRNSTVAIADLLESFRAFTEARDGKARRIKN